MHREHHLGVLGGHAHQRRHPHPEHRTRPAERDGGGHARDVAHADGRGEAGHQRRERAHLAGVVGIHVAAAPDHAQPAADAQDGHAAQAQLQVQARAEDQHQHRRPPDEAVQRVHPLVKALHRVPREVPSVALLSLGGGRRALR
jgi:hypothetical protein